MDYTEDDDEGLEYCFIIGKWIEGCDVELCENIDKCPYLSKDDVYYNNLNKEVKK